MISERSRGYEMLEIGVVWLPYSTIWNIQLTKEELE